MAVVDGNKPKRYYVGEPAQVDYSHSGDPTGIIAPGEGANGDMPKATYGASNDPTKQYAKSEGRKFDGGKARFELVPPHALEETAKVLTFGSLKYADDNWKNVPDGKKRYIGAILRHINAYKKGETHDPETGLNHMAHAICCAMFICDADVSGKPLAPALEKE